MSFVGAARVRLKGAPEGAAEARRAPALTIADANRAAKDLLLVRYMRF